MSVTIQSRDDELSQRKRINNGERFQSQAGEVTYGPVSDTLLLY